MHLRTYGLIAIASISSVDGGVCEELEIPMDTVTVPGVGFVCKVRECETPEYAEDGFRKCVTCDQGTNRDLTNGGTEFCPLELGRCERGKCVPRTDTTFFERNFGKKWTGLNTFNAITVTHYGGETASGGYQGAYDVDAIEKCMEKVGIDGITAVPPQMYGSDAFYGQAVYKRNNLCYKLVGADGLTRVVAVMDRCGGYVQCSGGSTPIQDISQVFNFPAIEMAPGATVMADANQCVINPGSRIHTGLGQRCWYFTDGTDYKPKACCEGRCGTNRQQVDWCGSSSHPHFDISHKLMDLLCDAGGGGGIAAGSCQLQWVEPIKCPVWPKPGRCCDRGGSCNGRCSLKMGSCGNSAQACAVCDGVWCPGDKWHDICQADPKDIPPPYEGWTTYPPDPPTPSTPPSGAQPRPPIVPPPADAVTPSTWPGGTTQRPTAAPWPNGTTARPTTAAPGVATTSSNSECRPITDASGGNVVTSTRRPSGGGGNVTTTTRATTSGGGGIASTGRPGHHPTHQEIEPKNASKTPLVAGAIAGAAVVGAATVFGISKLRTAPELEGEFEQADDGYEDEEDQREGLIQQESADFA